MVVKSLNKVQTKDLEDIVALDSQVVPFPWCLDDWKDYLAQERFLLTILPREGQILAFALFDTAATPDSLHLLKVGVAPEIQRQGVGKQLILAGKSAYLSASIYLEVGKNNTSAFDFYKSMGFEVLHIKSKFYSDGTDAYAMLLNV